MRSSRGRRSAQIALDHWFAALSRRVPMVAHFDIARGGVELGDCGVHVSMSNDTCSAIRPSLVEATSWRISSCGRQAPRLYRSWLRSRIADMSGSSSASAIHRGVDVLDVERDVQRNSAVRVEAEQMKHLFHWRTWARVGRANLESRERQSLSSHGDNHMTVPQCPHVANMSYPACPFARRENHPRKADYLPATLDRDSRVRTAARPRPRPRDRQQRSAG